MKQLKLAPLIHKTVSGTTHAGNQLRIALLPCGPQLLVVEREIIYYRNKNLSMKAIEGQTWNLFKKEFVPLGKTYDYVIFDCPPGIPPLSEVAIRLSDLVVVPTIPDFISVYGIAAFLKILWFSPQGGHSTTETIAARPRHQVRRHQAAQRDRRTAGSRGQNQGSRNPVAQDDCEKSRRARRSLGQDGRGANIKKKYGGVTEVLDQLVQEVKGVLHGN